MNPITVTTTIARPVAEVYELGNHGASAEFTAGRSGEDQVEEARTQSVVGALTGAAAWISCAGAFHRRPTNPRPT